MVGPRYHFASTKVSHRSAKAARGSWASLLYTPASDSLAHSLVLCTQSPADRPCLARQKGTQGLHRGGACRPTRCSSVHCATPHIEARLGPERKVPHTTSDLGH